MVQHEGKGCQASRWSLPAKDGSSLANCYLEHGLAARWGGCQNGGQVNSILGFLGTIDSFYIHLNNLTLGRMFALVQG